MCECDTGHSRANMCTGGTCEHRMGGTLMSNREGRAVVPMAIENMKNDPNINVGTRGICPLPCREGRGGTSE